MKQQKALSRISTHARISLAAIEIFVSENYKDKSKPKFLHLNSEIDVSGGHLPKQISVEGSEGKDI